VIDKTTHELRVDATNEVSKQGKELIMSKTKTRQPLIAKALAFLSVVFVIAATTGAALAQSATGQIIGKVTDPNGAVVAGAKVTVK
jgi:hypothetical protein